MADKLDELEKRIERLEKHIHYTRDALGCTELPVYSLPDKEPKDG